MHGLERGLLRGSVVGRTAELRKGVRGHPGQLRRLSREGVVPSLLRMLPSTGGRMRGMEYRCSVPGVDGTALGCAELFH